MTVRHLGPAARAARRAPVPLGHLRVDAGLVDEDEFLQVKMRLLDDPSVAPFGYRLLAQARDPGAGPCALRVLVERRRLRGPRPEGTNARYEETITDELRRIASERFADGGQYTLEALRCWGNLWFSLGAIDEAEYTAMLIFEFPQAGPDSVAKIAALKFVCSRCQQMRVVRGTGGLHRIPLRRAMAGLHIRKEVSGSPTDR